VTDLANVARKLRRIGLGAQIKEGKLIVYESWCDDCLLILGVKTYKEAMTKRAKQLEELYGLKLQSSLLHLGISKMVFLGEGLYRRLPN
jgi:hypothetical protein